MGYTNTLYGEGIRPYDHPPPHTHTHSFAHTKLNLRRWFFSAYIAMDGIIIFKLVKLLWKKIERKYLLLTRGLAIPYLFSSYLNLQPNKMDFSLGAKFKQLQISGFSRTQIVKMYRIWQPTANFRFACALTCSTRWWCYEQNEEKWTFISFCESIIWRNCGAQVGGSVSRKNNSFRNNQF